MTGPDDDFKIGLIVGLGQAAMGAEGLDQFLGECRTKGFETVFSTLGWNRPATDFHREIQVAELELSDLGCDASVMLMPVVSADKMADDVHMLKEALGPARDEIHTKGGFLWPVKAVGIFNSAVGASVDAIVSYRYISASIADFAHSMYYPD